MSINKFRKPVMRPGLNFMNCTFLKAKAGFYEVDYIQMVNNTPNCSAEGKGFTSCKKLLRNDLFVSKRYTLLSCTGVCGCTDGRPS